MNLLSNVLVGIVVCLGLNLLNLKATDFEPSEFDAQEMQPFQQKPWCHGHFFSALGANDKKYALQWAESNGYLQLDGLLGDFIKKQMPMSARGLKKWLDKKLQEEENNLREKGFTGKYFYALTADVEFVENRKDLPPLDQYPSIKKWWNEKWVRNEDGTVGPPKGKIEPMPHFSLTVNITKFRFGFQNIRTHQIIHSSELYPGQRIGALPLELYDSSPSIRVDKTRIFYHKFFQALKDKNAKSARYWAAQNGFIKMPGLIEDYLRLRYNKRGASFDNWLNRLFTQQLIKLNASNKAKGVQAEYEASLWVDLKFVKSDEILPRLREYPSIEEWWKHAYGSVGSFKREVPPLPDFPLTMMLKKCHYNFKDIETGEVIETEELF